jgi:ribonuclease HII
MAGTRPNLLLEDRYSDQVIVGVDEVGRGAWAGPVVVGAVVINRDKLVTGIQDSKKLNAHNREKLSTVITTHHACSLGLASVDEISEFGVNEAIFIAVERALALLTIRPTFMMIDGNYRKQFSIPSLNVIQGDNLSTSIAAASIIAKVHRDNLMHQLALLFPEYCWQSNVGYGTAAHRQALLQYGLCQHHRITYKPIATILKRLPIMAHKNWTVC